ncbi:MAG TPA: hypothetical protein VK783_06985 [Bacteroidia bacterium]|jgi:hypothetical protein|nr:hypothetical protein [Bacteroidia bacterium]
MIIREVKYYLLVSLLFCLGWDASAQDVVKIDTGKTRQFSVRRRASFGPGSVYVNFKEAIANATELYNNGEYDTCIAFVQHSLRGADSKAYERESLLELLVECYLEKDDLPNANRAMVRLLHNNPHYEVNDEGGNTEDFNNLANKYEVFPGFSIGIRNAILKSTYVTTKKYSLSNPNINYSAPYADNYGWYVMYYGWMEYEFMKGWSIDAEAVRYDLSYSRILANNSNMYASYSENMLVYRLPLYFRRYAKISKSFSCYAGLGLSFDRIASADAHPEYYVFSQTQPITLNGNIDVTNLKNQNNYEWLVAGGFGYTIKRLRLFLDLKYYGGITSLTNPSAGLINSTLLNQYYYVDSKVLLNQFEVGATAAFTLTYKVKKKK